MAFNKYKNGAWQEPEDSVRRYENGAWTDCDSAKRYTNGAWTEVWSNGIYYIKKGVLQSGVSTTAGWFVSTYDTITTSGNNLVVTINSTNTSQNPSKIILPSSLLNYGGKTLVIEGNIPSSALVNFKYWYGASSTSGSLSTMRITTYESKTSVSITIPSVPYVSDNKPYITITANSTGAQIKFSNIYILD